MKGTCTFITVKAITVNLFLDLRDYIVYRFAESRFDDIGAILEMDIRTLSIHGIQDYIESQKDTLYTVSKIASRAKKMICPNVSDETRIHVNFYLGITCMSND